MADSRDVLEKFYEAMRRDSKENDNEEIHVSSLCYDCMRKVYYQMTRPDQYFDLKTMITFWMGRAIHNTPILKESEIPLQYGTYFIETEDGQQLKIQSNDMIKIKRGNKIIMIYPKQLIIGDEIEIPNI